MLVCVINMFVCAHLSYNEEGIAKVSYNYTMKMEMVFVFLCYMKISLNTYYKFLRNGCML